MGGDYAGGALTINIVVTASLERLHESTLAAVTKSDDRKCGVLGVGANDAGNVQCVHLAHVGGADNGGGRIVFDGSEGVSRLRVADDVKPLSFQGVAEALGEVHIAIN